MKNVLFMGLLTFQFAKADKAFSQNLVTNSSFEIGTVGNNLAPTSWIQIRGIYPTNYGSWTTDVLDMTHPVFNNNPLATPSPSPDGGRWVGLSSVGWQENEAIQQTVNGFSVGQTYQVSFSAANFGMFIQPAWSCNTPGKITIYANGTPILSSSFLNVQSGWTAVTGTFVATTTSYAIQIDASHPSLAVCTGSEEDPFDCAYVQVDGLRISPVVSLGVTLDNFEGKVLSNTKNLLSWNTRYEDNTNHFIIERSLNLQQWLDIGNVTASGNSNVLINYEFTDEQVQQFETAYYRLRIVDNDGSETYSEIISIDPVNAIGSDLLIVPNPVNESMILYGKKLSDRTIRIQNQVGEIIAMDDIQTLDPNSILVKLTSLKSGAYLITVWDENTFKATKFIKL